MKGVTGLSSLLLVDMSLTICGLRYSSYDMSLTIFRLRYVAYDLLRVRRVSTLFIASLVFKHLSVCVTYDMSLTICCVSRECENFVLPLFSFHVSVRTCRLRYVACRASMKTFYRLSLDFKYMSVRVAYDISLAICRLSMNSP